MDVEAWGAAHLASVILSAQAFADACRSPAVRASIKKAGKPIVIAAAAQYATLTLLLLPISVGLRVVALLTGAPGLAMSSSQLASSTLGVYPFVTLLLTKYVYRHLLADCFFASLAEVNPSYAAQLAGTKPVAPRHLLRDKLLRYLSLDDSDEEQPWELVALMMVASLLQSWQWVRRGMLGYVVVPLAEFFSMRYLLGRPWAAGILTAVVLGAPALEAATMFAVQTWVTARALGAASMRPFLSRAVPPDKQRTFIRTFEATVVIYLLGPALLMRFLPVGPFQPLLGPLMVFLNAAIGARCAHDIITRDALAAPRCAGAPTVAPVAGPPQ